MIQGRLVAPGEKEVGGKIKIIITDELKDACVTVFPKCAKAVEGFAKDQISSTDEIGEVCFCVFPRYELFLEEHMKNY